MKRAGFTLIEVLMVIILIGLGVVSLVAASSSFTKANGAGSQITTAEFLVEQIKELTIMLPVIDPQTETAVHGPEEASLADYDDLDDLDGAVFSPPISAGRENLSDLAGFSQRVTVENVSASNFEQVVGDHSSFFVRVTVTVFLNSREICSTSWIRARYQ